MINPCLALSLMVFTACSSKEDGRDTAAAADTAEAGSPAHTGLATETGGSEDTGLATETGGQEDTAGTGNGGSALSEGFEADLSTQGGCGDFFIHAGNGDDTMTLHISGSEAAQAAHDAEAQVTLSYDLSHGEVAVSGKTGENLNAESCNDALDPGVTVVVATTYTATSGTLTIVTTPTGEATPWGEVPASAEVLLQDAVLTREDDPSDTVHVNELSMSVHIGWMPG